MESNKFCNRRSFFIRTAKATAALTLLNTGISNASPKGPDPENLAYCCFSCSGCSQYGSTCDGCRGTNVSNYCATCTVRSCAMGKGIASCGLCEELAECNKSLWQNYPSMKTTALNYQSQWLASPVENVKNNNIQVYPNPVNDWMMIELFNCSCDNYSIVNINGSLIRKAAIFGPATRIDVSNLKSGNYLLVVKNKGQVLLRWKFTKG